MEDTDPMRNLSRDRLLFAGLTFLIVFGSYLWTLSPTLTFWDAGEFITAAYILGIPHPPGTPLFVLLGHVFGALPLGVEFAVKTNAMSALSSSAAALFFFLVVDQVVTRIDRRFAWGLPSTVTHVAALAAVCMGAWGLTAWYNSTETEVYTVALATIGIVTFLVFYWADHLEEGKDWNLLLLVVFLMGLSIGNHLMALLVMPAVVVYALLVVWDRHRDYVLSLLVGAMGLYLVVMKGFSVDGILAGGEWVDPPMMALGLVVLGAGVWWMARTGSIRFFVASVALFLAGASVILYLKVRAGLDPAINEANPESWRELLAVLARKQYDVRPIWPRAVSFFQYQVPLYFDYLIGQLGPFQSRVSGQFGAPVLSLGVLLLAIIGAVVHFLADRKTAVYFLLVWLVTSIGLIVYLNFPMGNTQAPNLGPEQLSNLVDRHVAAGLREVRERDYFFIVSFVFLGMWGGIGMFAVFGEAWRRAGRPALGGVAGAAAVVVLLVLPGAVFALNRYEADRSDSWIARDFAYNVLESVEPYGILFTNGDNDTFPLWYLQEVEGVRRDVAVVNLALMNTLWYLDQLADKTFTAGNPPEELGSFPLADRAGPRPDETILDFTGRAGDPLAEIARFVENETSLDVAGVTARLRAGSILRRQDVGVLQIVRKNLSRRPIYFSVTVPDDGRVGMEDHLVREGITDRVVPEPAAELATRGRPYMPMQAPEDAWIDVPRTKWLLEEVYVYRGIDDPSIYKDPTARALIGNYGATFLQLAAAQARRGEVEDAVSSLRRGHEILGRSEDDEPYLTSLLNVFAVSGSHARLDSLLRAVTERRGERLEPRLYKMAAYNAAIAGHYAVADSVLQRWFRNDPRQVEPDLWIDMAEMAVTEGDTSRGLKFLDRAIKVDPDNQRAFLRHINLAHDIGNDVMAKTFLYQWIRTHPVDTVTARLYDEFVDTGELPEELEWENIVGPRGVAPPESIPLTLPGDLPGGG